jgi:transcriptional regulator GlxA family with amidase domain
VNRATFVSTEIDLVAPGSYERGGLAPWQLRLSTEIMLSRMASPTPLKDLAALVGLSTEHFCRSFKASTGLAPHRWLMNERIDAAKLQLAQGVLPISEITAGLGFYDRSHFTRSFARIAGTTPFAWQRSFQPADGEANLPND